MSFNRACRHVLNLFDRQACPVCRAQFKAEEGDVNDVDILCAALLHDTVEDTDTSFEEIEELFGKVVRDYVDEVFLENTFNLNLPFQSGDGRQDPRKNGTKAAADRGKHLLISLMLSIIENLMPGGNIFVKYARMRQRKRRGQSK